MAASSSAYRFRSSDRVALGRAAGSGAYRSGSNSPASLSTPPAPRREKGMNKGLGLADLRRELGELLLAHLDLVDEQLGGALAERDGCHEALDLGGQRGKEPKPPRGSSSLVSTDRPRVRAHGRAALPFSC